MKHLLHREKKIENWTARAVSFIFSSENCLSGNGRKYSTFLDDFDASKVQANDQPETAVLRKPGLTTSSGN